MHAVTQANSVNALNMCRLDLALQQNDICDIFVNDYTALPETDGIVVDRMDNAIKEYQSYADLTFSKDKIITWIDWHPSLKGRIHWCSDSHAFTRNVYIHACNCTYVSPGPICTVIHSTVQYSTISCPFSINFVRTQSVVRTYSRSTNLAFCVYVRYLKHTYYPPLPSHTCLHFLVNVSCCRYCCCVVWGELLCQ